MRPEVRRAQQEAEEEASRRLTSAGAVAEREESAERFRDLSDSAAQAAVEQLFGIDQPLWGSPQLMPGETLLGYVGDNAMKVDLPGDAGAALIESSLPLWAEADNGQEERVSTRLDDTGSSYETANSVENTAIAKNSEHGFTLLDAGVQVRPVGLPESDTGTSNGAGVFYGNVADDTDWFVSPLPLGAETFWHLRSPASPSTLKLAIDAPSGATLSRTDSGLDIDTGGETIHMVAPSSVDAQGRAVATSFELNGNVVTVSVDHRQQDVAYPVQVDPNFVTETVLGSGWTPRTWGSGPHVWGTLSTGHTNGYSAPWSGSSQQYQAPGDASVVSFSVTGLAHGIQQDRCAQAGIVNTAQTAFQGSYAGWCTGNWTSAATGWNGTFCSQDCVHGPSSNWAVIQHVTPTNNWRYDAYWGYISVNAEQVKLGDEYAPAVTTVPSNAPSSWTNTTTPLSGNFSATDGGLGVKSLSATLNGQSIGSLTSSCAGTAASPCPRTPASGSIPTSSSTSVSATLPEGDNTVVYKATDVVGNQSSTTSSPNVQHWKIDRSDPQVTLSGALYDQRDSFVGPDPLQLTVTATDGQSGTPSQARSGVKGVKFYVKEGDVGSSNAYVLKNNAGDQTCAAGSCGRTANWAFDPATYSDGTYTIKTVVTDQVGQETARTFSTRVDSLVNTSLPVIDGSATDGGTLDAAVGSWVGDDPIDYEYQWQRCDSGGSSCASVLDADGASHELATGDIGHTFRVVVTATNPAKSAQATSLTSGVVTASAPSNLVEPVVSGTSVEGETLTGEIGTWTGTASLSYAYQWRRCEADLSGCSDISGATSNSHVLTGADVNKRIVFSVAATNSIGSATARSCGTNEIASTASSLDISDADDATDAVLSANPCIKNEGLELTASGGNFTGTAQDTDATVEIPEADAGPIVLTNDAEQPISLTPQTGGSPTPEQTTDSTVAFDNGDDSSSVFVALDDGSIAVHVAIASDDAPLSYEYEINIPGSSETPTLEIGEDGAVVARDEDGDVFSAVASPWAKDRAGNDVPVHYEVDGNVLTLVVEHQGGSYQYPVVADPWWAPALVSSVTRVHYPGKGHTFQVKPTIYGRAAAYWMHQAWGWEEVKEKSSIPNWNKLREQYLCHPYSGVARFKSTWNLDTWRPDVSFAKTVAKACNP